LPVDFSSFQAKNLDCEAVELIWQTQSERNNHGFFIERSDASKNFESVAFIDSKTNSNTEQNYSFMDNTFDFEGEVYYRIKQVDLDGAFSYSDVKAIEFDCIDKGTEISIFPNPVTNDLYVNIAKILDTASRIIITNNLNQMVANQAINQADSQTIIDMTDLATGIYYIRVFNQMNDVMYTEKVIVTK